ncbi:MAG: carbohydrate ABC transporter permease, partial [Desulfobacterales bacterium]|nr:carbohydrate ABC transporter permease [Desulfobacterales bacterium]
MVITSVKTMEDIRTGNLISLPGEITFDAWKTAWDSACIGVACNGIKVYFWNSVKMVVPAVLISTLIGAMNGYVFSKWRFRGSEVIFSLLLIGCFIPFQVIILPMARTLGALGISQSIAGLVLVHVVYGLAFTTLFFRNFYVTIPDELVKAARIDGAGFFRIFWRILLPVSAPIFVVCIIWQTTQIWNDFLFGVVFSTGDTQPITVALNNLVNTSTG